jgi:hypothetical protein
MIARNVVVSTKIVEKSPLIRALTAHHRLALLMQSIRKTESPQPASRKALYQQYRLITDIGGPA